MKSLKNSFLYKLIDQFILHDLFTASASVAFFAILSLPAIIILYLKIFSALSLDLKSSVLTYLEKIMSEQSVSVLINLMDSVSREAVSNFGRQMILFGVLFMSATAVFSQIQTGLNIILHNFPKKRFYTSQSVFLEFAYRRLACFILFVGLIALLVVSVTVSSLIFSNPNPDSNLMELWYELGSVIFLALSFAFVFWVIPDAQISVRAALKGGFVTSILFSAGKFLIQYYLASTKIGSEYGAASSVVIFMSWIFYATLMFFVGAEVINLTRTKTHLFRLSKNQEGVSNEI